MVTECVIDIYGSLKNSAFCMPMSVPYIRKSFTAMNILSPKQSNSQRQCHYNDVALKEAQSGYINAHALCDVTKR